MVDYNTIPIEMLSNPLSIQGIILDEFKERLGGGTKAIVDANNVVSFMLESFSSMTGQAVNETVNLFPSLYPVRAQSSEDLYKHMSKYDYLGLFSSPSSCSISFDFDKAYLSANAVSYNDNYFKITIPKESIFKIGKYYFGIHYPVDIKINKQTNTYVVTYDTTINNPLQDLSNNTIEHREYTYGGMEFVSIALTVYQFVKISIIEDLTPNTGFIKVYDYTDKFYAMRLYHYINSDWVEIEQTLSDQIYNPSVPTAKLVVEPDTKVVKVSIPQTYFTNNLMGSKLKIELYTSQGELNADISEVAVDNISASFVLSNIASENIYSTILSKLPTIIMTPISTKIVGGSDGYSFDELASRVINDTFYGNALITAGDLETKFQDVGFSVSKYKDNLTERVYFCYKELTDSTGVIVASADITTQLTNDLMNNTTTIHTYTDNTITILPTTLFKYSDSICTPVVDSEITRIANLTTLDRINEFNDNNYTRSPFHIKVDTNAKIPLAYCYDLMNPSVDQIDFVSENINISSQLTVYSATVEHLIEGTGGFDITLLVNKTDDLVDVPDTDIVIHVSVKDSFNNNIWGIAEYVGMVSTFMKYKIHIDTDYNITTDHYITTTNFTSSGVVDSYKISLTPELTILLLVDPSHISSESAMVTDIASGIDVAYNSYVPTVKQKLSITLGSLVPEVFNKVDISYSGLEYATWEVIEYATYSNDVYATDEFGVVTYTIVDDKPVLTKLHEAGDQILDEFDDPIILHNIGDVVLSANGTPTISKNREIIYLIDLIHVDAKLVYSQAAKHTDYVNGIASILRNYFSAVSAVVDELIENTQVYFKPLRTLGSASFKQEETTEELPLEISMGFKLYVEDYVKADSIMVDLIRKTTLAIIDTHIETGIISMVKIVESMLAAMSNDIKYIDIIGINGVQDLQTLISVDNTVRPNLKQELYLDEDNTLNIKRSLTLEFVSIS